MNYRHTILAIFCVGFASITASFAQTEKELDTELTSFGRWVRNGEAITEPPVCYQLWRCESSNKSTQQPQLPKGEWGLCENYLSIEQHNLCTKCDAPPPIEACY